MHAAEKNNTPEDSRKMHRSRRGLLAEEGRRSWARGGGNPQGFVSKSDEMGRKRFSAQRGAGSGAGGGRG